MNNLGIILEILKENDLDYLVIVDVGVGMVSDVVIVFELGVDGVLLNMVVVYVRDLVKMVLVM